MHIVCSYPSGEGAAVLLRSLEPLQGQSVMKELRAARRKEGARQLKDKELCNGPSKLCQALNIPRCFDRRDLASDPEVWLETDPNTSPATPQDIVSAPRIGIESHGEWAKKPWRFYLRGHPCVSVVNKEAERQSPSGNVMNHLCPWDVRHETWDAGCTRTKRPKLLLHLLTSETAWEQNCFHFLCCVEIHNKSCTLRFSFIICSINEKKKTLQKQKINKLKHCLLMQRGTSNKNEQVRIS